MWHGTDAARAPRPACLYFDRVDEALDKAISKEMRPDYRRMCLPLPSLPFAEYAGGRRRSRPDQTHRGLRDKPPRARGEERRTLPRTKRCRERDRRARRHGRACDCYCT